MSRCGSQQREPLSVSVSGSLEEQVARLVERIAVLERRVGLNSRNSGKPPSSDGLAKPAARRRTRSLREKTGRKGEALRRAARPDRVEDHVPVCRRGCGASLSGAAPAVRPSGAPPFGDGGASGSRSALRSLRGGGAVRVPDGRVGRGAIGSASCRGGGVRSGCGASAAGGRPCPGAGGGPARVKHPDGTGLRAGGRTQARRCRRRIG